MANGFYDQHCNWIPQGTRPAPAPTDDLTVRYATVGDRQVRDYTSTEDNRACPGHRTDNIAGYVVRHTITGGETITRADGRVGVDVYAVESTPTWGNYDKAREAARALCQGGGYAVVDCLYRCGHRSY